jgi:ABC-type polysaccharide/polyol phosphate export permease
MSAYFGAIWTSRYFWLSLVRMDLRARYRGSVLGIGWSLLHPIGMTVILCTVFTRLFQQETNIFVPYVFAGLTFWNYWIAVAAQGCHSFFAAEAYIRQFPAPMAIYPLRTMLASAFHFAIGLLLVFGVTAWFQGTVHLMALVTLLPNVIILLAFGWGVALLFGLATVRFRDTKHLTEICLQAWFYLTPVMYPKDLLKSELLKTITMKLNPLMPFLDILREPIVYGRAASLATYGTASLIVLVLGGLAALAMSYEERKVIFNL